MTEPNWTELAPEVIDKIWSRYDRVNLVAFLEEFLKDKGMSLNDPIVTAKFDSLKRRVMRLAEERIEADTDRGITPKFRFGSSTSGILLPQYNASSESLRGAVKLTIGKLSWKGFERLSAHALRISGATRCYTMRGSKEEGIDYFGVINLGTISNSSMWHESEIRILGQAKAYEISEPIVRLFQNDMSSFAQRRGRAWDLAPSWFKEKESPMIGFVISANRFTGDAIRWAKGRGITTRDIDQLTEVLVGHPRCTSGIEAVGNGSTFSEPDFLSYFETDTGWSWLAE